MARNAADREDLYAEATGLEPRWEWRIPGEAALVIAGTKRDGGLSLYFGPDAVCHFDDLGRLRRLFHAGNLYRSNGKTLTRLRRERTDDASQLLAAELTPAQTDQLVAEFYTRIEHLRSVLAAGAAEELRSSAKATAALAGLIDRLATITTQQRLAPEVVTRTLQ
jgi:hypothetical protein